MFVNSHYTFFVFSSFYLTIIFQVDLQRKLEEEQNENSFSKFPNHFIEISTLLLEHCDEEDEIIDSRSLKILMVNIMEARLGKLRKSLSMIKEKQSVIKFNNLSYIEINRIRPFFTKTMNNFNKIASSNEIDSNTNQINNF